MKKAFWIGILLTSFLLSCESEAEKKAQQEQRLQAEAARRVADYISAIQKNCDQRVLDAAIQIADSLMLVEARLSADTILRPIKPIRPEKPETKILKDTTPIQPFMKPKRDTDTIHQN